MPTDRTLITVSDLVRKATAIVDPQGEDPAVVELAERHGDDDEPVRGVPSSTVGRPSVSRRGSASEGWS